MMADLTVDNLVERKALQMVEHSAASSGQMMAAVKADSLVVHSAGMKAWSWAAWMDLRWVEKKAEWTAVE